MAGSAICDPEECGVIVMRADIEAAAAYIERSVALLRRRL
jgi:hypothetical protein